MMKLTSRNRMAVLLAMVFSAVYASAETAEQKIIGIWKVASSSSLLKGTLMEIGFMDSSNSVWRLKHGDTVHVATNCAYRFLGLEKIVIRVPAGEDRHYLYRFEGDELVLEIDASALPALPKGTKPGWMKL